MELNKAVLDCMQSLRRRLREEMSIDIRLSQPDAITAMLSACLDSNNEETRLLGQKLAGFSDTSLPAPGKALQSGIVPIQPKVPTGSLRMYRGQRVYT
ncbi:hypothetical protein [Pseudomonas sp. S9]|uniref:hypothetical protein n=1 Tax=Pseudomonas sp. S9 TaxID=686578 RepID=UPI00025573ED|nr:hypothetical protein [Pseudomonas sp. S9]